MRASKHRLLPVLARLALILLIQCPLPVLHAHGDTAAELSSIPSLPEHVRRFHESRDRASHEPFGWHLHILAPLGTPGDQRGDDQDTPDVDLPWRADSSADSDGIQLIRLPADLAAEPVGNLPCRPATVAPAPPCDTIGEICRRQRQAILRA